MSKYNNTTKILFSYGTSKSVSNIQYCSIIFHDLPHCDSSSEPEVESWQWSTSTGRSSKPPSFKQILVHPSLCVWTSALTIDALKIEFQAYIFNIFISYFMYMLGVDYHILYILKYLSNYTITYYIPCDNFWSIGEDNRHQRFTQFCTTIR